MGHIVPDGTLCIDEPVVTVEPFEKKYRGVGVRVMGYLG